MAEKKQCFIIQPFTDEYKERCDGTYKPAIEKAGFSPRRADEDYTAKKMKIESIKEQIEKSAVCLAEITEDRPNVWYELGFADGRGIPVVLICDRERDNLPFDVNQRDVCFYHATSQRSWEKLQEQITRRLKIAVQEAPVRAKSHNEEIDSHDGSEYGPAELLILRILYYDSGDGHSRSRPELEEKMQQSGFESMDRTDAFTRLEANELIRPVLTIAFIGSYDNTSGDDDIYKLTEEGTEWCLKNKELLRGLEK